jgi:hypothetical protein
MHIKPYLLPVVVFLLVGPGVGVLTVMLVGADGASILSVNWLLVLFGYGIGAVPAALAGVIYVVGWPLRGLLQVLSTREFGAVLGAVSGVAALAACFAATSGTPFPKSLSVYVFPLVAGAVCGALAAHARDEAYGGVGSTRAEY